MDFVYLWCMKKFLTICLLAIAAVSCKSKYNYEATLVYNIYYPNGRVATHTVTRESTDHPTYLLSSDRGSNYLYINNTGSWFSGYGEKLECTNAPIEVVSFTKRKKN